MKTLYKSLMATAIVAAGTSGVNITQAEEVAVEASVGVSNMYLWRGFDLGDGSPAIFGDLTASIAGAYASIWASSGDDALGNEYDLIVGYGGEFGDFSYDINYSTYLYPEFEIGAGDAAEVILTLGYGPISVAYYDSVGDVDEPAYYTISGTFGDFELKYGAFNEEGGDTSHVDLTYSFNDNLSFTVSKIVDDNDGAVSDDPLFAFSLSLPIE